MPGMRDLIHIMCETCAVKQANFGLAGGRPTHCKGCKPDGMLDVCNQVCRSCGKRRPVFGLPGGRATHCKGCAPQGMRDVLSGMCQSCGDKRPNFGLPGGRATHCGGCRLDGMHDVKNGKCQACGVRRPNFGLPGGLATHCRRCSLAGMRDVRHRKCQTCGERQPVFGLSGGRATHCVHCKTQAMTDVRNRTGACRNCGLPYQVALLREGLCCNCRRDIPRVELLMRQTLRTAVDGWIFDKSVAGVLACSDKRYRPDAWLELETHVIVVECDEQQHQNYEQSCELRRVVELWAACEGRPLVMIRWNPDGFLVDGRVRKVATCQRHRTLTEAVQHAVSEPPSEHLTVQYLFYDEPRERALQDGLAAAVVAYRTAGTAC